MEQDVVVMSASHSVIDECEPTAESKRRKLQVVMLRVATAASERSQGSFQAVTSAKGTSEGNKQRREQAAKGTSSEGSEGNKRREQAAKGTSSEGSIQAVTSVLWHHLCPQQCVLLVGLPPARKSGSMPRLRRRQLALQLLHPNWGNRKAKAVS